MRTPAIISAHMHTLQYLHVLSCIGSDYTKHPVISRATYVSNSHCIQNGPKTCERNLNSMLETIPLGCCEKMVFFSLFWNETVKSCAQETFCSYITQYIYVSWTTAFEHSTLLSSIRQFSIGWQWSCLVLCNMLVLRWKCSAEAASFHVRGGLGIHIY